MFGKYHNALVNFGLSDEEYDKIRDSIVQYNYKNLNILGGIGVLLMLVLGIYSFLFEKGYDGTTFDYIAYFGCAFVTFLSWLFNRLFTKKNTKLLKYWIYILVLAFMVTGALFGLLFAEERPAVSYVCYLIILPVIFSDRPYRIVLTEMIMIIGYSILCIFFKDQAVLSVELMNIVFFGALSIIIALFFGKGRIKGFNDAYKVNALAHMDSLTDTRNRNYYEEMLNEYPNVIKKSIACIYMDVNGLHELNNTKGHVAGDQMLKLVGSITKNNVGNDNVYRTGGDEFVSFVLDNSKEYVDELVNKILKEINESGFNVAVGVVYSTKEELEMTNLVAEAEQLMYKNKVEFYKLNGSIRPRFSDR